MPFVLSARKVVALALAVLLAAAALVVAPLPSSVPIVGDNTEQAYAHTVYRSECREITRYIEYNWITGKWVIAVEHECKRVRRAHSHTWRRAVRSGISVAGCIALGGVHIAAGALCAIQMAVIEWYD